MNLPPCPIPGHDQPHHWHNSNNKARDCLYPEECFMDPICYSAHIPEPAEPAGDGWARVPVGVTIPNGTTYRYEDTLGKESGWTITESVLTPVYVRRSDLDKLTPPDPAAMLAGVLTGATGDDWTAADVHGLLQKSGGLTLTLGAEK